MPTIDILGVPHVYELTPCTAKSRNPVLVFIHGWLLSRHYWQPLLDILSLEYQCLLYDLRGFGDSQVLPNFASTTSSNNNRNYTLAAYAEDLDLLLQYLNIEKVWLIGHSLGGSIALWGAKAMEQKVEGVICLNSGGGIYLKEEFERFRTVGQQLVKFRPYWLSKLPWLDLIFARMMVARPLTNSWGRQRLIDFVRANRQAALGALLDSTTEAEVHLLPKIVAQLQQPVYFLAGKQDQVMELKYVHHLASFHQLFKQNYSNVIEIADCGHLSMLEQPRVVAEIIANIVSQFQLS
ncbi:MAG: alpha/beta hydrolase [Stanieria sp.]